MFNTAFRSLDNCNCKSNRIRIRVLSVMCQHKVVGNSFAFRDFSAKFIRNLVTG